MNSPKLQLIASLMAATLVAQAGPLDKWTWRNPLPSGNTLNAVTYGAGQFVAVGQFGAILTSPDGLNWAQHQSSVQSIDVLGPWGFQGVAYGHGQFVAVGYDSILTSEDGTNWQPGGLPADEYLGSLRGVTYGNGHFVAVGEGSELVAGFYEPVAVILTSDDDGWTWTRQDTGLGSTSAWSISGVAYAMHQFVAIAGAYNGETKQNESALLTSSDGLNWTPRQIGTANELSGVGYANGQFVVASHSAYTGGTDVILTSGDGTNWIQRQPGTSGMTLLGYGNGQVIATTGLENILTSADGVTWIQRQPGGQYWLSGATYGDGRFVAVGEAANLQGAILSSPDETTWTDRGSGPANYLYGVAYGNGLFVAVGDSFDSAFQSAAPILTSADDGATWIPRASQIKSSFRSIAFGEGRFVGAGDTIVTSADGVNWTQAPLAPTNGLSATGVGYGNHMFVVVGQPDLILTSTDATTWVQRRSGAPNHLDGVAFGNGQFVAVGESGTILSSTDSANWTQRNSGITDSLYTVAYGNGRFVATAPNSAVLTSTDGVTWTRSSGLRGPVAISFGNGQFVAVVAEGWDPTFDYSIQTSTNGLSWVRRGAWARTPLSSIAFGQSHFVAVGWEGSILQSGSSINLGIARDVKSGQVTLSLSGPSGIDYMIQSSTDLLSWQNLTNTGTQSTSVVLQPPLLTANPLFYRAYSR